MKSYYTIIALSVLLCQNCNSQYHMDTDKNITSASRKINSIEKIQLKELTRGRNRIYTFSPDALHINLNGADTQQELSPANWESMARQAVLLDLSKISTYAAPTTGRYSDSALSSTIIITSAGKTYESASFDEGIPPKELEGLYLLLKGKSKIIKKR